MIHIQPYASQSNLGIWQLGDTLHVGSGCCRNFLTDQSSSYKHAACKDCGTNYVRSLFAGRVEAAISYRLDEKTDQVRVGEWIKAWTGLEVLVDIGWF